MKLRVGFEMLYDFPQPTPMIMVLGTHFTRASDVIVPDWAGWRAERAPVIDDLAFFDVAPDWVCEILSPSTSRIDRAVKLPLYQRYGVSHVWLLDPIAQTLEVLEREASTWRLKYVFSGEERVRAAPFDAIELDLGAL